MEERAQDVEGRLQVFEIENHRSHIGGVWFTRSSGGLVQPTVSARRLSGVDH